MYTNNVKGYDYAFSTKSYGVAINPQAVREKRRIDKKTGIAVELQEPNYLVINFANGAIEFTADQLPAAISASVHFTNELDHAVQAYEEQKRQDKLTLVKN